LAGTVRGHCPGACLDHKAQRWARRLGGAPLVMRSLATPSARLRPLKPQREQRKQGPYHSSGLGGRNEVGERFLQLHRPEGTMRNQF
jgi:hypothetical protein